MHARGSVPGEWYPVAGPPETLPHPELQGRGGDRDRGGLLHPLCPVQAPAGGAVLQDLQGFHEPCSDDELMARCQARDDVSITRTSNRFKQVID
ncbi:hypothetical protein J6590_071291 [Homalodisca vitripennis]|nr:hypothetical protein J6590_071291 [Homalodisca vitripennis]